MTVNSGDADDADAEEEGQFVVWEENRGARSLVRDHTSEIKITSFETLVLEDVVIDAAKSAWSAFSESAGSSEAAGEAIFASLFESAPTLQSLFVTPRAVQALRFMTALHSAVTSLHDPSVLKTLVESMGFQHLNLDVTLPRVIVFRDAILDLFEVELEDRFTQDARSGWMALLNYIGGSFIYIKTHYGSRLQMLVESWRIANSRAQDKGKAEADDGQDHGASNEEHASLQHLSPQSRQQQEQQHRRRSMKGMLFGRHSVGAGLKDKVQDSDNHASGGNGHDLPKSASHAPKTVPSTFHDMFQFNATVMGFGKRLWMKEVLASFSDMVENVADSGRLQEECDVLALRITRCVEHGTVNLAEYKSCMLASLRQLLMKEWNTSYETAWNWFWDSVEHSLNKTLGSPLAWEGALDSFLTGLDESKKTDIIAQMYERFFAAAPAGQDYFKQSTSRLHFIGSQLLRFSLDILRDPWKQVDDISALGLRHVGYAIPTELFSPFVTAAIQAVTATGSDSKTVEAFRWSLALISKILVRTVNEGSTIVMKAINVNSAKQLQKAVSCAPRGERAKWLLVVKVGTHSISPLSWAIESGSLEAADAIIRDLLTIRADRERYYYGADELFGRHPELFQRLVADAPSLLPTLLEGLVWRSREVKSGSRRANYYVRHLLVKSDGSFSDALKHLVACNDPQIICHPLIILVSDTLWSGIVRRQFINSRIWLILSLVIMMMSQAILPTLAAYEQFNVRVLTFVGRLIIYVFTMARLIFVHSRDIMLAYRRGAVVRVARIPIPGYLQDPYHVTSIVLAVLLLLMSAHEPMLYCAGSGPAWPTGDCADALPVAFRYSVFCMLAMGVHWLMLMDLAVFNTGQTAFLLVIVNVLSEIGLFLVALSFLLLTFASAITVLEHSYEDMSSVLQTFTALSAITLQLYEDDYRDFQEDPVLLGAVFLFVASSAILLLNLLIAQLNCSYVYIYQNMVGFARLKRADVIVETLATISAERWRAFAATLQLESPLEFNEGDIGMAGGIALLEPASEHSVTHDSILRFGGSSSAELCWPDETSAKEEDRLERLERLLQKTMKRVSRSRAAGAGSSSSGRSDSDVSSLSLPD